MKTSLPNNCSLIQSLLAISLMTQASFAEGYPRGTINVARELVRRDTIVPLNWQIQYPYSLASGGLQPGSLAVGIQRGPSNSIVVNKNLIMNVRVLGASFRTNRGHGNNVDGFDSSNTGSGGPAIDLSAGYDDERNSTNYPVEVLWSRNNSAWTRIYYGTPSTIVAASSVLTTTVNTGDVINFGGRVYLNSWLPMYSTAQSTPNVVVLRNGDPVPSSSIGFKYGQVKGYLAPYLSSDKQTIQIGARDLIILMELDEANPRAQNFDLQDMALLVTFE